MLRTLLMLTLMTAPAYAEDAYCSDDMPMTAITPVEDSYVLSEGYHHYTCERRDAQWHKCDNRDDYLVHFEQRDGKILIALPTYEAGQYTEFAVCQ